MLKLKTFDTFNVEQVPILTSTSGNFYRTVVMSCAVCWQTVIIWSFNSGGTDSIILLWASNLLFAFISNKSTTRLHRKMQIAVARNHFPEFFFMLLSAFIKTSLLYQFCVYSSKYNVPNAKIQAFFVFLYKLHC